MIEKDFREFMLDYEMLEPMSKEQLRSLKKKISELSDEDKKQRDLYLRNLAMGVIQGPPVGYPSIDKPWLSDYSEEDILSDIFKRKIYDEFRDNCYKYADLIAIEYFGNKITYRELLENTDLVAESLVNDGVSKGDKVTVCMPYLPETIYIIYALNKIGAVVNMVDPRINAELITKYINAAQTEYAIIIDKVEKKIEKIINDTNLRRVISISPLSSMGNPILRLVSKGKKSIFTKWDNFIVKDRVENPGTSFVENDIAVIEYTSGTSGNPKGVMLSNEAFNSLSYFQKQSCEMRVGSKFLLIMPPFIAYGLVIGMHNMLSQGQHLLMIPNFTLDKAPKMLPELIDKYHPNWIMGVPNFLQILMDYEKDLSFLEGIIIGGDHLEPRIEQDGREFFKRRGSSAMIYKGWGMTEIASCGSFTKINGNNRIGSVGIPLSKNNIMVLPQKQDAQNDYDVDGMELSYGEEGVLFISSPSITLGYYENEAATKRVIYTDSNGIRWVNTGDMFRVEQDGSMFYNRREKRVVVRPDGHNIPTDQIEHIGSSFEAVENSVVIGTPCQKYEHGNYATLCLTLKDKDMLQYDVEQLLYEIERECNKELQPRDRAKYFVVIDELPYTMNAKVDYDKLMKDVNDKIQNMGIDEETRESFYVIENYVVTKKRSKIRIRGKR